MAGRSSGGARGPAAVAARAEQLTGAHVVLEALRARRRKLYRLRVSGRPDPEVLAAAEAAGVPVEAVAAEQIAGETDRGNPQRVSLEAGPLPEVGLEALCAAPGSSRWIVLLDAVEDPQNLGAIARVAEAAGAVGLVTATRRTAPLSPSASRASAGALEWLPVARVANLRRAMDVAREHGFWTLGADPSAPDSLYDVPDRVLAGDLVVVLGAEGRGLRPGVAEQLDHRVRIPMLGRVASLNVSAAGAILLFELVRRRPA